MADLINEIIDPSVPRQIEEVNELLAKSIELIGKTANASKSIGEGFKGVNTISALNEQMAKSAVATDTLDTATRHYTSTLKLASDIIAVNNGHSKELTDVAMRVAVAKREEAQALKLTAEQKKIEAELTARLTKEQERLTKEREKESKIAVQLSNDYELLKKAYKDAADKAKNLGITLGTNHIEFKKASAGAMQMHQMLLKVESAVGQSQRNVGNYTSSIMALNQVIREAPAFANSMQTGLAAIGNNLPILIDEFKRLRTEVGGSMNALKILGGSLFSFTNIFVLGFTALQFFVQYLAKAKKETNEYTDALKAHEHQSKQSAVEEMGRAQVLISIAKDQTAATEIRTRAVKQLQDMYPDYLGNLSKEAIMTGDITKEVTALNEALFNKALMEAANKKVGENAAKYLELTEKLEAARAAQNKYTDDVLRFNKQVENYNKNGGLQPIGLTGATARRGLRAATEDVLSLQSQLEATRKEGDKFIQQGKEYAKAAGFLAVGKGDKPGKSPNGKKSRDLTNETLSAEQDLTKELYAEYAKRLEIEAEMQRAIYMDETRSLEERVIAYRTYAQRQFEAKAEMLSAEYTETEQALTKIADIEKKAADKRTPEEKALALKKEQLIAHLANVEAEYEQLSEKSTNDTQQAITKIYEDEVKKRIAVLSTIKTNNDGLMQAELADLQEHYGNSLMSTAAFQQKQKDIKDKYAVLNEQSQLDYLKDELANLEKQGIDVTSMNKAIAETEDRLRQAELAKELDGIELKKRAMEKLRDLAIQFANEAARAIIATQNAQYDSEIAAIQKKRNEQSLAFEQERRAIESSAAYQSEKAAMLSDLNARQKAQENESAAREKQVNIEKAKFQKDAAKAEIIAKTAVAIAAVLPMFSNPLTVPFAIAQTALIAGIGAAQLAVASNAPIPAYKEGTGLGTHPGGAFIAGDGNEPEYIKAPGKKGYWSKAVSTLYNEGAGTTVTPLSRIKQFAVNAMHTSNRDTHDGLASIMVIKDDSAIKDMTNKLSNKLDDVAEVYAMFAGRGKQNININIENNKRKQY